MRARPAIRREDRSTRMGMKLVMASNAMSFGVDTTTSIVRWRAIQPRSHPGRPEIGEQQTGERIDVGSKHRRKRASPDHLHAHGGKAGHEQNRQRHCRASDVPGRCRMRLDARRGRLVGEACRREPDSALPSQKLTIAIRRLISAANNNVPRNPSRSTRTIGVMAAPSEAPRTFPK